MPANERTPLLSDAQEVAQQAYPDLLHAAKVVGALQAGKLPSNAQLGQIIDILTSKTSVLSPDRRKGEGKLSANGQTILADIRDVLIKLKAWGEAKNQGDVLQELLFQIKQASVDADLDVKVDVDAKAPASKEEVKQDLNNLAGTFQTLGKLVLQQTKVLSSEAKDTGFSLSGEIILLARDLLADAAEEVATLADAASKDIRPEEGEQGKVPTKEDLKNKGKQVQDKAKEEADKGKARLEKESAPAQDKAAEVKDKAVDRLIQIANKIQEDPAYKKAFKQLFGLLQKYYHRTEQAIEASSADVKANGKFETNEETQRALDLFKKLLSNFADGKSTEPIEEKAKLVVEDIKKDERLSKWVEDVERFLNTLVDDAGYATSKAPKRDAGKLYDRAQDLLKENAEWKEHTNDLVKELEGFGKAIADDKQGKELAASLQKLGNDMAKTAKVGINMFKGQAGAFYRDAVNVVLPRVLSLLKEVPIPRTEYKSPEVEFVIDNLTITSVSFVPDNLVVTNHSEFAARRIGRSDASAGIDSNTRVRFDGLRFAAKDVSFWVRRPGAIILSEERGLLDFSLTGSGLSGDISLALADEDSDDETYFKVLKSKVNLKNLNIKIHDNYHYILSTIFTPLLKAALKLSLESVLSAKIAESFEFLDWRAYDVRRRAVRYQTQGYPAQQAYFRALSEPAPSASTEHPLSGLHATKKGLIRDDRGPHDAQIAIGGEQLLPGHSGPKSSLDRAARKANNAANEVNKKVNKNLPSGQEINRAKKDTDQLRNIVQEEFADAEATASAQRNAEDGDATWKSDVFDF